MEPIHQHSSSSVTNNVFFFITLDVFKAKKKYWIKSELFEKCSAALCDIVKNCTFFLKALEKKGSLCTFYESYLVWSKSLQKFYQNFFWERSAIFDHFMKCSWGVGTPCRPLPNFSWIPISLQVSQSDCAKSVDARGKFLTFFMKKDVYK